MTGISVKKIFFNDSKEIELQQSDIVVFVGPNNVGKSQTLRDIYSLASYNNTGVVVKDVELDYHNIEGLKAEVVRLSVENQIGQNVYYKGYNYSIHHFVLDGIRNCPLKVDGELKKFLISMVRTDERLNTSDPKTMVNYGQPQNCPLQYATNAENRKSMSKIFQKTFSKHIYSEDRGSAMLTLHMGDEINFCIEGMSTQDIVDEQYKRICELPKVHEQGDGIRSLAGLLLNLMMPNYSVFLIDEPEAFLHPPQARILGENLPEQLGDRQAFIATHSIELIKGLLTKAYQRVKIIRITRDGNLNPIKCLEHAEMADIWNDSIMRHTNIIDCIFYHHTVLCESDSDCLLYGAMLNQIKDLCGKGSDALFIHCGGKGKMHKVVKALKSLGVNYRVIPDIDIFNERTRVKRLYEVCGGNWTDIEADYKVLFDEMNQPDGTVAPDDFVKEVRRMIDERGWTEMTKPHANRLGRDLPQLLENQWDKLKHNGVDFITNHVVRDAIERLIKKMNSVGIFPVRKGEPENFFPDVGSHGPGYAVAVLEKYPNLGAAEYNEMREFVKSWGI